MTHEKFHVGTKLEHKLINNKDGLYIHFIHEREREREREKRMAYMDDC
jgi:hypothetical protein